MARGSYKEERATSSSLVHRRHLYRQWDDDSRVSLRCSRWIRRGGFVEIKHSASWVFSYPQVSESNRKRKRLKCECKESLHHDTLLRSAGFSFVFDECQ